MRRQIALVILLVIVTLLTSCCPSSPALNLPHGIDSGQEGKALIMVSSQFLEEDRSNIEEGVAIWVRSVGDMYSIEFVGDYDGIDEHVGTRLYNGRCVDTVYFGMLTSFNERVVQADQRPGSTGNTTGLGKHEDCGVSTAWLVIDRIKTSEQFVKVAAHEFGHAMGLQHIDHKGSIMNPIVSSWTESCITKEDAQEFCSVFYCNIERIRYCVPKKGCEAGAQQ